MILQLSLIELAGDSAPVELPHTMYVAVSVGLAVLSAPTRVTLSDGFFRLKNFLQENLLMTLTGLAW